MCFIIFVHLSALILVCLFVFRGGTPTGLAGLAETGVLSTVPVTGEEGGTPDLDGLAAFSDEVGLGLFSFTIRFGSTGSFR